MFAQKLIIPRQLDYKFKTTIKNKRIILFSAFCGYGKYELACEFLKKFKVSKIKIEREQRLDLQLRETDEVMLIENLHLLKDEDEINRLSTFMNNNTGIKFVFITQGRLPAWLMPYQLRGELKQFQKQDFIFQMREVKELADWGNLGFGQNELEKILRISKGYPLGVHAFVHYLLEGGTWNEETRAQVGRALFGYMEKNFFEELEEAEQRLLLNMAPFTKFTSELAHYINGWEYSDKILDSLLVNTTILSHKLDGMYEMDMPIKFFINWKFNKEFSEVEKLERYTKAGEYYEEQQQFDAALHYYSKAKHYEKIKKLLIRNSEQNPGNGHYLEMEKYYLSMPREEILLSPGLMCGMSFLMSMRAYYEKSDAWYQELVAYGKTLPKSHSDYHIVQEKLLFLDIGLPQKSNESLMEILNSVVKLLGNSKRSVPSFSITSRLPSVLNGGKDFSDWAQKDDILYTTLRKILQKILGNEGIGVVECGMCESKFEKGQDYAPYLVKMMSVLPEVQQLGTLDVEFAIIGTIARIHISQGKAENAKQALLKIRDKFTAKNELRFHGNIDAMLAHIALLQGDINEVTTWKKNSSPQENENIWTMWRYQYFVKIESMIQELEYVDALLLLTQLRYYTQKCKRRMDEIHVHVLMSICYYRMNSNEWKISMQNGLKIAQELQFTHVIAQYGMAILPMFTDDIWNGDKEFYAKVLKATRIQATYYQQYLKETVKVSEKLSGMELAVLRLICQNKSNQEIGEILGIKLPTVKTHVSNIFRKLEVRRRTEAKTEAIRRNLVEEYI